MLSSQVITDAIKKIHAETGKIPTNQHIRDFLGKGSFTQINPVLKKYKGDVEEKMRAAVEMPPELATYVQSALAEVWSVATGLASKSLEEEKASSKKVVDKVQAEYHDALTEIAHLETLVATLSQEKEAIGHELHKAKGVEQETRELQIKLSTENKGLTTQLGEKKTEITELKKEVKELREHNNQLDKKLLQLVSKK